MPTGYTARILEGDGITFEEFAKECARAFGALIMMRDKPASTPLPTEIKPDPYYYKAVETAKEKYREMSNLSDELRTGLGQVEINKQLARARDRREVILRNRRRIKAMMDQVREWEPPTSDHVNFKTFMLDQLHQTMQFDGDTKYVDDEIATLEVANPVEYGKRMLSSAKTALDRAEESLKEEEGRSGSRNTWLQDLLKSLR